ncbi:MAG: hypothetical protein SVM79_00180 [Chloroflexota bacterium]|nr:hypothetical protein [Chloroflexota bacterium]
MKNNTTNKIDYATMGADLGKLVDKKQAAYGDSFGNAGKMLAVLYPDGICPEQFDDMLTIVRIIDKLFRIANDKGAFCENPYQDIAGYGLLGMGKNRKGQAKNEMV